jgi:hypothetical protein
MVVGRADPDFDHPLLSLSLRHEAFKKRRGYSSSCATLSVLVPAVARHRRSVTGGCAAFLMGEQFTRLASTHVPHPPAVQEMIGLAPAWPPADELA